MHGGEGACEKDERGGVMKCVWWKEYIQKGREQGCTYAGKGNGIGAYTHGIGIHAGKLITYTDFALLNLINTTVLCTPACA